MPSLAMVGDRYWGGSSSFMDNLTNNFRCFLGSKVAIALTFSAFVVGAYLLWSLLDT